jgi:hypothetical protein
VIDGGVRASAAGRVAAAGVLALALPSVPLAVAAAGRTSAPLVLAVGAASVALLAAWLGPAAWPGTGRAPAVERVLVTATVGWAAALDAAVAGMAVRGGDVSRSPAAIAVTAGAYAVGCVWSLRAASEVWWRWPVACALAAAVWIAGQAAV